MNNKKKHEQEKKAETEEITKSDEHKKHKEDLNQSISKPKQEEIEKLLSKISENETLLKSKDEEIAKLKNSILYEKAELDNFRKRSNKEKDELRTYIQRDVLTDILPVLDNLERALQHSEKCTKETLEQGINLTLNLFKNAFSKFKVQSFESIGKAFNPELHEALSREEKSDLDNNTITQEYAKGYMIGNTLLRPAQVVVSYKPEINEKETVN